MSYYAVANGRTAGIFATWSECSDSVKGFSGAIYKKFSNLPDAQAFLKQREPIPISTEEPDYYVYTDGSCINNGKEGAAAGIGVFFGEGDPRNVSEKYIGRQTNNAAELAAILRAYSVVKADVALGKRIVIVTDSEYVLKCVSTYGEKCEKNRWQSEIPNKEMVKAAYEIGSQIGFMHISAHTGKSDIHSIGNANADRLANEACVKDS